MKKILALLTVAMLVTMSIGTAAYARPANAGRQNANQPSPSIVEVAIAVNADGPFAGQFDTLIAAVLAADPAVLETLSGRGQFTVFAPTDDAFAELGFDADNIGTLDQGALTQILLYHVARGSRDEESVIGSTRIRTLQGGFLSQSGGTLTDNLGREANIIVTDVPAANGMIHAINAVVLPFAP